MKGVQLLSMAEAGSAQGFQRYVGVVLDLAL